MTGLVLNGGCSVRFGSDKSRYALPGEGQDMLLRTPTLLRSVPEGQSLAVSCRSDQMAGVKERIPANVSVIEGSPTEQSSLPCCIDLTDQPG